MLAWRMPVALLQGLLAFRGMRILYGSAIRLEGPVGEAVLRALPPGTSPEDARQALQACPALPSLGSVLPWLLLLAPLGVLGAWLHNVVWDHTCLWMLRGAKRGWRPTLVAEARAMEVGALGEALILLGMLPELGCVLALPCATAGLYCWILRGFAVAAWQGCEPWRGALATVLHALLMLFFALALGALILAAAFVPLT